MMFDANCNLAAISLLVVSQYLIWRPHRLRLRAGEGCVRRVVGLVPSLLNCFLKLLRRNGLYQAFHPLLYHMRLSVFCFLWCYY